MRTKKDAAVLNLLEWGQNLGEIGLYFLFYEPMGKDVESVKNISYGPLKRNRYDIYYKKELNDKKKPLFIYFHGGGYISGTKEPRKFYCKKWLEEGYVAVNVNYHYKENYPFKDQLADSFKAVAHILSDAEKYNIDTENIIISGESAGAHIASMVSQAYGNREIYENFAPDFPYKDSFRAKGCVLISGIYETEKLLSYKFVNMKSFAMCLCDKGFDEVEAYLQTEEGRKLAVMYYLNDKFPPSVIIKSKYDLLAPDSDLLKEALDKLGVPNELCLCDGVCGVHAGGLFTKFGAGKKCLDKSKKFIQKL